MKSPQAYKGSEQTYVKHFFLERYLERVAYNIFSFTSQFVYVDGFSGPWKSRDQEFKDTSFIIALDKLVEIREGRHRAGRYVDPRCIFIESDPEKFKELQTAISSNTALPTIALNGSFEDLVSEIVRAIGDRFSFVFIDPTGWTGFDLRKIRPLIELNGEVLINFMFDHINRFMEHPNASTASTFNSLFGGESWYPSYCKLLEHGMSREDAIIEIYMTRLKQIGGFRHVTSTRIKKPLSDRSYFYLVYGTRHWKGIWEFRKVERQAADEQEKVTGAARHESRALRTGQNDLFASANVSEPSLPFERQREQKLELGQARLLETLKHYNQLPYEEVAGKVLEVPLVWARDLNGWLIDLHKERKISISGFEGRRRTPRRGDTIRWIAPR